MIYIILDTLIRLLGASGLFIGFVFILYCLQKITFDLAMKNFGTKSIYITGIVGVSIHELSHLIVIFLSFHKILKIDLFKPNHEDHSLGSVTHSYNPKNILQEIGNVFIGIAPLFGGVFAIYELTKLLLPNHESITTAIFNSADAYSDVMGATSFISSLGPTVADLTVLLLHAAAYNPWSFLLWFYLTASISLHLSPSAADMHGLKKGFINLVLLLSIFTFLFDDAAIIGYNHLSDILLNFSVVYSLCIVLAGSLSISLFIISILKTKLQEQ